MRSSWKKNAVWSEDASPRSAAWTIDAGLAKGPSTVCRLGVPPPSSNEDSSVVRRRGWRGPTTSDMRTRTGRLGVSEDVATSTLAFLFGAVIPHDGRLAKQIRSRAEDLVVVLLLPIFFAFTGMRTQIGLLSSASDWLFCGLIIVVATMGKFGGSFAAAKLSGLGWRESSAIGILMNTRGLMELIVLNVGLDMGVLSPTLFAMLVIMALVTTFATSPILDWLTRDKELAALARHQTRVPGAAIAPPS